MVSGTPSCRRSSIPVAPGQRHPSAGEPSPPTAGPGASCGGGAALPSGRADNRQPCRNPPHHSTAGHPHRPAADTWKQGFRGGHGGCPQSGRENMTTSRPVRLLRTATPPPLSTTPSRTRRLHRAPGGAGSPVWVSGCWADLPLGADACSGRRRGLCLPPEGPPRLAPVRGSLSPDAAADWPFLRVDSPTPQPQCEETGALGGRRAHGGGPCRGIRALAHGTPERGPSPPREDAEEGATCRPGRGPAP